MEDMEDVWWEWELLFLCQLGKWQGRVTWILRKSLFHEHRVRRHLKGIPGAPPKVVESVAMSKEDRCRHQKQDMEDRSIQQVVHAVDTLGLLQAALCFSRTLTKDRGGDRWGRLVL